jgi:putative transposase
VADTTTADVAATVEPKTRSRKRAKDAATHVVSWPLRPDRGQKALIQLRFDAGLRMQNACLGEALKRSNLVKTDPAWLVAEGMPRNTAEQRKQRSAAFAAVEKHHKFSTYDLMSYASSLRVGWMREQVLSQEAQVLGRLAFEATARWHYGTGAGRPRFKSARRGLRTLSVKDLFGSMRPKVINSVVAGFQFSAKTLIMFATPGTTGRKGREQTENWNRLSDHILEGRVLSSRIVKTTISGRVTYRAQFTIDGPAPSRHPVGTGRVSLDLGPSQVAVAVLDVDGATTVFEWELAPDIDRAGSKLRLLQRKLDRQHRAGSPECFNPNGTHRTRCVWSVRSSRALATVTAIADTLRRIAAARATAHGQLTNTIIGHGSTISAEKLNYVSWQKNFPRSVRDRAPGMFMEVLRRKAESAGDQKMYEYSVWTTALSQTCVCGERKRKPLSQRVHTCECGVRVGRDRMSAYLGLFVTPMLNAETGETTDLLDLVAAQLCWDRRNDVSGLPRSETPKKRRGQRRTTRGAQARHRRAQAAKATAPTNRKSRSAETNAYHPPTVPPITAGRQ